MSKSDIRFAEFDRITLSLLKSVNKGIEPPVTQGAFSREYLSYNPGKLKNAVDEYFNKLRGWKSYFLKNGDVIDRHKVSALAIHYILKHSPLESLEKGKINPTIRIINETLALNIAIARLDNDNDYKESKPTLWASLYRVLLNHRRRLFESADQYEEFIPDFIYALAHIIYSFEKAYLNSTDIDLT